MAHTVQVPAPGGSGADAAASPLRRVLVWDLVGLGLFLAGAGWSAASAAIGGHAGAGPVVRLWLGCGAAVAVGLFLSGLGRWVPALVVVIAGAVFAVSELDRIGDTLFGPLGYSNASAALFAVCATAGLLAFVAAPGGWGWVVRVPAGLAAVGFAAVVAVSGSFTAMAVMSVVVVPALIAGRTRWARLVIACFGAAFVAVFVATVVLGLTQARTPLDRFLSANRPLLWHEALRMTGEEPTVGVGPGRFFEESAVQDSDLAWAHNGFLQQGAEAGAPGLVLALAVVLWCFVRLAIRPGTDRAAAVAGAAVCMVAVHACVDYVLHFPAIPLAVAFLVGAGAAPPWPWARRVDEPAPSGPAAAVAWTPAPVPASLPGGSPTVGVPGYAPLPAGHQVPPAEYQPQQWHPWQPPTPPQPPPAPGPG